jgi:TrmH family RNA methyltransferase
MMEQFPFNKIESAQNSLIKQIKVLQTPGIKSSNMRAETGLALIEGIHLVQAWLGSESINDIQKVIFSEQSILNEEIKDIVDYISSLNASSKKNCIDLIQVSDSLTKELTQLGDSPFLLGIIQTPSNRNLSQCIENTVILDGIQDSGNVGTILRTAAAAGYKNIVCLKGTAQVWSPKVLRAGMGAHTALLIWDGIDLDELLNQVKIPMISARLTDSANLYEVSDLLKQAHAWIFGNEGAGVSQAIQDNSTGIFIPQAEGVESLNVAAAAAVCLFETRRILQFS